jgi:hypothetical protein
MQEYFEFTRPDSERLLAHAVRRDEGKLIASCPLVPRHKWYTDPTPAPVHFEVSHNRRDELIIWGWTDGCVVHERLLADFEREGFSGYRTYPGSVRFRDGSVSEEYRRFIVAGWAGIASPESGVRLIDSCSGCMNKTYSPVTDFDKVIDWSQWNGDDFFIVWPLIGRKLITSRVAQWLSHHKIRSLGLSREFESLKESKALSSLKFERGRLSDYLPQDVATKYGGPLGLE